MAALLDIVKKGSTDRSVTLRIIDSTDGTPETGVVFNTSGIDLWYRREGAAKTSITEATLAALTTAHSDGGFLHVGDGIYRLDLPDAAFATGANYVDIGGTVTGMIVIGGRVKLTNIDMESPLLDLFLSILDQATGQLDAGSFATGTVASTAELLTAMFTTDSGETFNEAVAGSVVFETANNAVGGGLDAAGVRSAVGLASANLDTQLTAIDDVLDTEVAAIKAKTDSLTFTAAGKVDAAVKIVNTQTVAGSGTTLDPWRAA